MNRMILLPVGLGALFLQGHSVLVSAVPRSEQRPKNAPFQWDWKHSRELPAEKSLRKAKIPSTQKKAIAQAIGNYLRPICLGPEKSCVAVPASSTGEITSDAELQLAVLDTRVALIDLNHDGVPEVVAQGMLNCGATGNCPFWIFQKTKAGYELLLDGEAQMFTVQKSKPNGFCEIVLSTHGSSSSGSLVNYRYVEGVYQEAGCYYYDWTELENDKVRELKAPRITPCR